MKPVPNHTDEASQALAMLGMNEVVYLRMVVAKDALADTQAPPLPPDALVCVLHAANGRPLGVAESHQAARAHAREHNLRVAALH